MQKYGQQAKQEEQVQKEAADKPVVDPNQIPLWTDTEADATDE